ncbi:hypothetical protein FNO01nite_08540 [Flavobacterium noncentrifugens]|uniref:DNA-binding transcriptional regulator, XRE-family HTH domain n=1 Tax=Flavobacterium noncentrifugens TaxID=1128970 RepID=A0A1G8TEZ7_9FLAO|nr:helix-turn-helix transcriptional regulator [Flavobacterium noncentrifugens]GEP50182.1 hypothetical protein FNO01nite_08540 [Flavobacterium noncentrifugens]SDJ39495.1 DNA-binding transcriptional regulator, XRE-family HTH domain [Flavobacterium noncentrifugens]
MDKDQKKIFLIAFGAKLRQLRETKGFTQEKLANDLGIEISQISRIERGVLNTSVATLYSICKVLKISSEELLNH